MACLHPGGSFQRRATALLLLEVLRVQVGPIWTTVDSASAGLSWTEPEAAILLAVLGDNYEINRLSAFNLLQTVPWPLQGLESATGNLAQLVSNEAALQSDLSARDLHVDVLIRRAVHLTGRLHQARSHEGALLFALVFTLAVQQRDGQADPAIFSRADKAVQLLRLVERHLERPPLHSHVDKELSFTQQLVHLTITRVSCGERK